MLRKFCPVVAIRRLSAEWSPASPKRAAKLRVTTAEATNAGSSDGNSVPSASHRIVVRFADTGRGATGRCLISVSVTRVQPFPDHRMHSHLIDSPYQLDYFAA